MSRFLTQAGVSVKGWCKRDMPRPSFYGDGIPCPENDAKHVEIVISLTNNERFITPECGDTRLEFRFVDERAARGEGWNVAYNGRAIFINRDKLNMRGMGFDWKTIYALVGDQSMETQELFWELLSQFNEIVFHNPRSANSQL